jgi:hypothetical protein
MGGLLVKAGEIEALKTTVLQSLQFPPRSGLYF